MINDVKTQSPRANFCDRRDPPVETTPLLAADLQRSNGSSTGEKGKRSHCFGMKQIPSSLGSTFRSREHAVSPTTVSRSTTLRLPPKTSPSTALPKGWVSSGPGNRPEERAPYCGPPFRRSPRTPGVPSQDHTPRPDPVRGTSYNVSVTHTPLVGRDSGCA